jgi:hypothetical protein
MTEPDAFRLGVTIAAALDDAGLPNALGGAIALAAWGVPRATVDVDMNVFVGDADLPRVFDVLERLGVEVDRDQAMREHEARGMFVVRSADEMRIDVFTPSIDFSWEAAKRVVRRNLLGSEVSVLSAESLAVFKLLFFRSKDIADLERLVGTQKGRMDTAWVRKWISDMMGDDDPRVSKWDELVRLFG